MCARTTARHLSILPYRVSVVDLPASQTAPGNYVRVSGHAGSLAFQMYVARSPFQTFDLPLMANSALGSTTLCCPSIVYRRRTRPRRRTLCLWLILRISIPSKSA